MATEMLLTINPIQKKELSRNYQGIAITETITNGFFTVDQKWIVTYWNKAAEKLLGVEAKDIIGKNLWEKFVDIIPLNFYTVYQKAFLQDIPRHFKEYWAEMGSWFDVITYHTGDKLSVSFKSSNQPKPLHPGAQLKILNELYRFVTEVTNDCLWEWDLKSEEFFWIDGGHKRVFGYNIENALIPKSFWESCIHPDDKARILKGIKKIITGNSGTAWEEEYRFKKADGTYAYVHDRGHIIYDKEKPSRMIGATQDISARKLVEKQLLESEKQLSLIAKETVNALIITDIEEKITWVNKAFTKITGYKPEEAIGKTPGSLLQGKDTDPTTIRYMRNKIQGKKPFDCEIVNYTKTGNEYWMHIQSQPILDDKGNTEKFFAIGTDITEKVLMKNKLADQKEINQREMTDAVLTAQETEREDFGKELHDNVNQILGASKLYIEAAKTNIPNRQMYLNKSSEYIVKAIEEIRKISKILIPPGMHNIGLVDGIKNLLKELEAIHPIKFNFKEENIDEEEIDKKMQLNIFRIVQEQITNILKHSKADKAYIYLSRQEDGIELLIKDNGIGYDTSGMRKGVGITNIISRAGIYKGKVTITSKPDKGYALKVLLALKALHK
jgi:PAS domain S-box-containing protein